MKRIFTFLSVIGMIGFGAGNTYGQCVDTVEKYDSDLAALTPVKEQMGGYDMTYRMEKFGEVFYGLNGVSAKGFTFDGRSLTGSDVTVDVSIWSLQMMGWPAGLNTKLGSGTVVIGSTEGTYVAMFDAPVTLGTDICFLIEASGLSASDSIEVHRTPGNNFSTTWRFGNASGSWNEDLMMPRSSIRPILDLDVTPTASSSSADICEMASVDLYYDNAPAYMSRDFMQNALFNVNRSTDHFEWNFGDGSAVDNVNQNPSHTFNTAGSYQATLTNYFEGYTVSCTESAQVTVDVVTQPVADFNLPDNSSLIVDFTSNSTDGSGWSWDFGDGNISTDENPSNTYAANGTYDITLTTSNACGSDVVTKTMVFSVGIEDMGIKGNVVIYPNPVEGELNFNFKGGLENEATVEVYNMLGTKVAVETIQTGTTTYSIETANLKSGKYLVRFVNKEAHFTITFVKI